MMQRLELRPYQGKVIRVRGLISGVKYQPYGGSSQICLEDIRLAEEGSPLTSHAWFNLPGIPIAKALFEYIRDECKNRDQCHGYDWNRPNRYDRVGKHFIDNRQYQHEVIVRAKVKKYSGAYRFGFGYIEDNEIYLCDKGVYIIYNDERKGIEESDASVVDDQISFSFRGSIPDGSIPHSDSFGIPKWLRY